MKFPVEMWFEDSEKALDCFADVDLSDDGKEVRVEFLRLPGDRSITFYMAPHDAEAFALRIIKATMYEPVRQELGDSVAS